MATDNFHYENFESKHFLQNRVIVAEIKMT